MLSKAKLSYIRSLEEKKNRQKEGLFVVEGEKMLLELSQSAWECDQVYLTSSFLIKHPHQFSFYEPIDEGHLKKISFLKTSSAGLAIVKLPPQKKLFIDNSEFYVVLDGIRDPGNLGTIIRTLDWFGIKDLICSQDTVDFTNPKVIQSSMGSVFRVNLHYLDLPSFLADYSGKIPIFAADISGENAFKTELSSGILIIGNEADGVRSETKRWVDKWIHIPKAGSRAESLNASIATAILCAERFRQIQ